MRRWRDQANAWSLPQSIRGPSSGSAMKASVAAVRKCRAPAQLRGSTKRRAGCSLTPGQELEVDCSNSLPAQLFRLAIGWSTNTTGVPFLTLVPSNTASQFVNRTHPCDSALPTFEGFGVP